MTYKTSDLAKMFKVTKNTIILWTKKYNIPHETTLGGHLRYTEEAIEAINKLLKEKHDLK